MYTVANQIRPRVLSLLSLFLVITVQGQTASTAKNFVGVQAGIGWATTTLTHGAFYERIVFSKGSKEAGIKLNHTGRYKYGNIILFSSSSETVSRADLKFTATGYLYTNKLNVNTGFFLSGELGASMAFWKTENASITQLQPAVELGLGWKWALGNNMNIRWTNALVYLHPSELQPYGDGIITTTAIALGF
jgi:hypothetical protein